MFEKVFKWFKNILSGTKNWFAFGVKTANQIKAIADSKILDAIVAITPTDLDNKLLAEWRRIMVEIVKQAGMAEVILNQVTNPDAYASVMHVINATGAKVADNLSGGKMNIQQALTAPQMAYDEKKVIG